MTAKCTFCNDTKIEPGVPGPCVWCEVSAPVATNTVERFTIAKLRYAGGKEHEVSYVSEVAYDALLEELRLAKRLQTITDAIVMMVDGQRDHWIEKCGGLKQRLTVADQRADDLEADAARYRWLRKTEDWEKACGSLGGDYRFVSSGTGMGNSSGECLDAEIDALMQAAEGEGS